MVVKDVRKLREEDKTMTSKQRAYLKGLAMNIEPIFQVGKSSLTPEAVSYTHLTPADEG